jgi:hypothetical protein
MKTTARKIVASMAIAFPMVVTPAAHAEQQLNPLAALACEAVLCLSVSAGRPAECAASISHYFGIIFKKPWKTIQARANFLKLCPDVSEDDADAQAQATIAADAASENQAQSESQAAQEPPQQAPQPTQQSQQSKQEIQTALATLKPLWNEQTAQSVAAREVLEKCAAKHGGIQSPKCVAEKEDFDGKRLPAIVLREEVSRLETMLANTQ